MKFWCDTVGIKVSGRRWYANLKSVLTAAVKKAGIRNGILIVQSLHTTCGLLVQEDEEGILQHDMPGLLGRLVPSKATYQHDDLTMRRPRVGPDERKNGQAHMRHLLVAHPSLMFIVHDYGIEFGSWPSPLLVDFDPVGRKSRRIKIAVLGE